MNEPTLHVDTNVCVLFCVGGGNTASLFGSTFGQPSTLGGNPLSNFGFGFSSPSTNTVSYLPISVFALLVRLEKSENSHHPSIYSDTDNDHNEP
jgi:hypothetical protein